MAVTKELLSQYYDLKQEEIEVNEQINNLRNRIDSYEQQIYELERNPVKDKVYGGFGGTQGFVIEGIDERDLKDLRVRMLKSKQNLEKRLETKRILQKKTSKQIIEIERFMNTIEDSLTRRIIYYRFVKHLPWERVASEIGISSSEASVKQTYYRYMEQVVTNVTQKGSKI